MKYIKALIALCIVMLSVHASKAQSYMQLKSYQDTANYLIHEVEMKKYEYLGKPFSILLDDLKLKPVDIVQRYWTGNPNNKELFGNGLTIYFKVGEEFEDEHFMIVEFKNVPSFDALYPLFFPSQGKKDLQKILNIYKQMNLKYIGVKIYSQDEPPRPGITDNSKL